MDLFDALTLIGGLCLFLYGMNVMGESLERRAGNSLQSLLSKLTTGKIIGLMTGLCVTAVIQSSSATTVMVVGFVNSGLMTLSQSINVIMGANIGTTVTAWILSLSGIDSANFILQLFKPMSFTPILAAVGIVMTMFFKDNKKKDTGTILLGFAVLMFGMDIMTDSVSGLSKSEGFRQLFLLFDNPILGLLAGAVLTAIIQSSSASVGILQALAVTGQVTYGAAIPIVMGQSIGTCVTAVISSFGTNKSAKRAAMVHLLFNVIGAFLGLILYYIVRETFQPELFAQSASLIGIAVVHTAFKVANTAILLPLSSLLEKLVCILIPDAKNPEEVTELDERLLATPSIALERCRSLTAEMAACSAQALTSSLGCLDHYTAEMDKHIRELEDKTDHYEDVLGTYLVKLSANRVSDNHSAEAAMLLKVIGDFERIADHSVNLMCSAKELHEKGLTFSPAASKEIAMLRKAVEEIVGMAQQAFDRLDVSVANKVEPLEQIIDEIKELLRTRHIQRLQQGSCSIEAGFIWSDLLTNLGRVSDHCSNIAGGVIDLKQQNLNTHEALRTMKSESTYFKMQYAEYAKTYLADL